MVREDCFAADHGKKLDRAEWLNWTDLKVSAYKIIIHKPAAYPYTNTDLYERERKKTMIFKIAQKFL